MSRASTSGKRPGRPRARPREHSGEDPRGEILVAAARLFTTVGYSAGSTRQIAEAVGLRQASLFYYFPRKADILAELLDRTVQPALDFAAELAGLDAAPAVKLYLLIRGDVRNFCRPPGNLGSLQLQVEARASHFDGFWAKRAQLRGAYQELVDAGIATGELARHNVILMTATVFGLVESVSTWFDPAKHDLAEVQRIISEAALRAVLAETDRFPALREEALALGIEPGGAGDRQEAIGGGSPAGRDEAGHPGLDLSPVDVASG